MRGLIVVEGDSDGLLGAQCVTVRDLSVRDLSEKRDVTATCNRVSYWGAEVNCDR